MLFVILSNLVSFPFRFCFVSICVVTCVFTFVERKAREREEDGTKREGDRGTERDILGRK